MAAATEKPASIVQQVEDGPNRDHMERSDEEFDVAPEAIGTGNLPPGYFYSPKFIGTLIGVTLMNISLYVGYVLPVNVLSIINEDIGPSPNIILVPIVKTLGGGVGVLLVGRLGDIFGRRWFLIGGQCLGLIGAVMGATAKNVNVLMGSTAFIGVAGAVQLTFSFVVQELVPNKYRGYVVAVQFILSFPFACFGPVMARSFVLHTEQGWRWCYYLNMITCGMSLILFFFFYHPPNYGLLHQGQSMRRELKRLDYVGLVLYCCGLIMLLLGISWGGKIHPWNSPTIIGLLVGGITTIVVYFVYETYLPFKQVHALVPIKTLKSKNFIALCVTGSVATMVYNSMNVLWPQMIGALFTTDIMKVGWYSCALGGSVAFGQICAGITVRPFGKALKAHWQMRVAAMGMCSFVAGMASITIDRGNMAIAFMALAGFSVGYVELLALIMVPFTCSQADIGLASGFQSSCRGTSGTIVTAIYATVLANRNLINIPGQVGPAAIAAGLPESSVAAAIAAAKAGTPAAFAKVPGMTPQIQAAITLATRVANAMSFKTMFLVSLAFGVTSVIGSFFIGNLDEHLTDEVARKLQDRKGPQTRNDVEEAKSL